MRKPIHFLFPALLLAFLPGPAASAQTEPPPGPYDLVELPLEALPPLPEGSIHRDPHTLESRVTLEVQYLLRDPRPVTTALFLTTTLPVTGPVSHPDRARIEAWLDSNPSMIVAAYVRSQADESFWYETPPFDPFALLPQDNFDVPDTSDLHAWRTLFVSVPGENLTLPCRSPSAAQPGAAVYADPNTGELLDPASFLPPLPAYPAANQLTPGEPHEGWVLCLAPEGPLENVILESGSSSSFPYGYGTNAGLVWSRSLSRTRTLAMGQELLLSNARVIGQSQSEPDHTGTVHEGNVWLSFTTALSYTQDIHGEEQPRVLVHTRLRFEGMHKLPDSWQLSLADPLPLRFCRDPGFQDCSSFEHPDTPFGVCSPSSPGELHEIVHNSWMEAYPCTFPEGAKFWIVMDNPGGVMGQASWQAATPVWEMTVLDASWPALTTEEVCRQTACLETTSFFKRHLEEEMLWDITTFDGLLPLIQPGERANGIRVLGIQREPGTVHFLGGERYDFDPQPTFGEWPDEERLWIFHEEPWIIIEVETLGYSGLKMAAFTLFNETRYTGGYTSSSTIYSLDSRWPAFGPMPTTHFRQIKTNLAFVAYFPADYPLERFIVIGEAYAPSGPAFMIP